MHGFVQDAVRVSVMQIGQVNPMTALDLRDSAHSRFANTVALVDMDSYAENAVGDALAAIDTICDHFRAEVFPMTPELDKLKADAIAKVEAAGSTLNGLPVSERAKALRIS